MDFYMMIGIVIMLVVAAVVVAVARHYQTVREETGYKRGRYYRFGQHMGSAVGNYQMDRLGVKENDGSVETDEKMFYFTESDKKE